MGGARFHALSTCPTRIVMKRCNFVVFCNMEFGRRLLADMLSSFLQWWGCLPGDGRAAFRWRKAREWRSAREWLRRWSMVSSPFDGMWVSLLGAARMIGMG
jgi:hypothetical protein